MYAFISFFVLLFYPFISLSLFRVYFFFFKFLGSFLFFSLSLLLLRGDVQIQKSSHLQGSHH